MLHRITLFLARNPQFPQGSARHGYEIVAPLDATGHLDAKAWLRERDRCVVRRFWGDEPDESGRLVHRAGGADGATWLIDYDADISDDDEAGFRLNLHVFAPGEYVTISDYEGPHTFRVAHLDAIRETPSEKVAER